jgi:hypothetical protein
VDGVLPAHSSPARPFFILILAPLIFMLVPLMPRTFLMFALFAFFLFAFFAILVWIFGLRH